MSTITDSNEYPFGITPEDIAEFDRKQEANKMTDTTVREDGQDVWDFMLEPIPEKDSFFTPIVLDALSEDTNAEMDGDDLLDRAIERNGGHIVLANMDLLFDTTIGDSMKFKNKGESLDKAIENNGGHIVLSGTDILLDKSW